MRLREKKARLAHAREKIAAIAPICESITGLKLNLPKLISTNRLTVLHACWLEVRIRAQEDRIEGKKPRRWKEWKDIRRDAAFTLDEGALIALRLRSYKPGTPEGEYILAHELGHAILEQNFPSGPIRETYLLEEGLATFIGEKITQDIHPGFSVLDFDFEMPFNRDVCSVGYEFFSKVAAAVSDPLVTISMHGPQQIFDVNGFTTGIESAQEYLQRVQRSNEIMKRMR